MYTVNHTDSRRVWRLLGGLLFLVLLSGCMPTRLGTAVPLGVTTIAPAVTPTRSVTPTPSATPSATPSVTPVPSATLGSPPPTEPPSGAVLEVYAVVGVAHDDVLNVRAGAGVANQIVGTIPPNGLGVQISGEGQMVGQSFWAPVVYGDVVGWVNTRYLAQQVGQIDARIVAQANRIVQAMRDGDWTVVARFVHPEVGVRFSPYAYVREGAGAPEEVDRVFQADEIEALAVDATIYRWGYLDGTGEPIDLDFAGYVERFVYDVDYAQPHVVGYDETVGRGNTIDNIAQVYPGAVVVEYHFTGFDPQLAGLDWRSLRLVLEKEDGEWYLVGVVHDEWTI